jgi:hypothetical protein
VFEWVPYNLRHPSTRFDHGTYDASHFSAEAVENKITKDEIKMVFQKLSDSEYWFPKIVPTTDGTHLFLLFLSMFLITTLMFVIGVYTKAVLFSDIVFFPFILIPLYFMIHVLVKAKRRKFDDSYLDDRESDFMNILMKLNQSTFRSRGVRFEVGEKGAWIELHFSRPIEALEKHHQELEQRVKKEVNENLANELYLAGLLPFGIKSWNDFN